MRRFSSAALVAAVSITLAVGAQAGPLPRADQAPAVEAGLVEALACAPGELIYRANIEHGGASTPAPPTPAAAAAVLLGLLDLAIPPEAIVILGGGPTDGADLHASHHVAVRVVASPGGWVATELAACAASLGTPDQAEPGIADVADVPGRDLDPDVELGP